MLATNIVWPGVTEAKDSSPALAVESCLSQQVTCRVSV